MNERERLRQLLASTAPIAPQQLYDLALEALDHSLFEQIVARVEGVPSDRRDHRLWQILGLARRAMLDAEEAQAAFARAAELAPQDALIAHSVARTTAEAGRPALDAYRRAQVLNPSDGGVMLGIAVARLAEGDGTGARVGLAEILSANPGWYDGHVAYARIAALPRDRPSDTSALTVTVEKALREFPQDPALWRVLIGILLQSGDYPSALRAITRVRGVLGDASEWTRIEASSLSESGDPADAQVLFDRLGPAMRAADAIHPIRNLIRLGKLDAAATLAERSFGASEDVVLWPYRALLWRVLGDPRWQWLEGDPSLIGSYDLGAEVGDLESLAETLRALHARSGTMLDQSVRGGTQTDGNLFARAEPMLRRLRDVIHDAVSTHVAQLPPPVTGHPTLIEHRAPLRFAGAWSVRLNGGGHHVDHVHPHGWLSSAFYVTLPKKRDRTEGWLALGECRDLLPELDGFRSIEPVAGRLVLFPSTMWHGTRRFRDGERMTVAFDVARP